MMGSALHAAMADEGFMQKVGGGTLVYPQHD